MRLFLSGCLLTLLGSGAALAAPLIINGGFESGDFTGWMTSGSASVQCGDINYPGHSGNCAARIGLAGMQDSVTQSIPTVPGASYSLDFWLAETAGFTGGTPTFLASWDGHHRFLDRRLEWFRVHR
jgi:hypothetical protein